MNRSRSFKTDKHRWEPVLTEDELAVALAKKETDRLMATELERKLLRLRARRLAR